jgi:hypothetical protein
VARLGRILAVLVLVLVLAIPASASDTWERVCALMGVPQGAVERPRVVYTHPDDSVVRGVWGLYVVPLNTVVVCTRDEAVLAHEFTHAILSSHYYQEREAERMEKYFR